MCVVPKRCNDMMNVGRLQGFDVMWLLFKLAALSGMLDLHLQKADPFCLDCCLLSLSLNLSDTMFQLIWVHLICFWGGPSSALSSASWQEQAGLCSVSRALCCGGASLLPRHDEQGPIHLSSVIF